MAESSHTRQAIKRSWDRLAVLIIILVAVAVVKTCTEPPPPPVNYWEPM